MEPPNNSPTWTVIVISGGRGRRLGGADKASLLIGGVSALDHLIESLPPDTPIVVAGSPRSTPRPVLFQPESPPGGGPVAGIAAAIPLVRTNRVALVAVDMPGAGALLVHLAREFDGTSDALLPIDADGRRQPLCSVWSTEALRLALARLGDPRDRSMKQLLEGTTVNLRLLAPREATLLADIDTREDLIQARRWDARRTVERTRHQEKREVVAMDDWIEAIRLEFDLDVPVDVAAILDVARVAAHNVARPAAPITTFLLGIAIARGADLASATETITALAEGWTLSE